MLTYDIDVAGLKRTLPLCHVSDDLYIAAFVIFGDVELTVHSAAELLKLAPEYDYLIAPEAKSIPLLYEMVLNGVGAALIPDSYYNPKDGISAYRREPGKDDYLPVISSQSSRILYPGLLSSATCPSPKKTFIPPGWAAKGPTFSTFVRHR